jgi:hypothetical protein
MHAGRRCCMRCGLASRAAGPPCMRTARSYVSASLIACLPAACTPTSVHL